KNLPLLLRHGDGSTLTLTIPFTAAAGQAQPRLVTILANTMKPGKYTASTRAGDAEPSVAFAVYPSEHANAYCVGQWCHHGETWETTLAKGGWMYMTSDLATLMPRRPAPKDRAEAYVAARMTPYARMILGGGHQLDLDLRNDWGDPWVQRTI